MVLEAARLDCLDDVLVITAGLSVQDPNLGQLHGTVIDEDHAVGGNVPGLQNAPNAARFGVPKPLRWETPVRGAGADLCEQMLW